MDPCMVLHVSVAESVNQAVDSGLDAVIIFIFRYVPYNVPFPVRLPSVGPRLPVERARDYTELRQ